VASYADVVWGTVDWWMESAPSQGPQMDGSDGEFGVRGLEVSHRDS
jgi:hypothetical protein